MQYPVFLVAFLAVSTALNVPQTEKKIEKRGLSHLHDHGIGFRPSIGLGSGGLDGFSYAPSAPIVGLGTNLGSLGGGAPIITPGLAGVPISGSAYAPNFGYGPSIGISPAGVGPLGLSPISIGTGLSGISPVPFTAADIPLGSRIGGLIGDHPITGNVVDQHVTVTNRVAVPVPQPYPVPIERPVGVPVPTPVRVPVDRPYPVPVPHRVVVPVERPVPVPVERPVPVPVPHPVPVAVPRPVAVPVPRPVAVPVVHNVPVPVPHPVDVHHHIPIAAAAPAFIAGGISAPIYSTSPGVYGGPVYSGGIIGGNGPIFNGGYGFGYPHHHHAGVFLGGHRFSHGGLSLGGTISLGPLGHFTKHIHLKK